MTDASAFWQSYFEAIAEEWRRRQLIGNWPSIQRIKVDGFREGRCHQNAEQHAASVSGMVVHGYLFMHPWGWNEVQIFPHSIVRLPDGRLVDPTPHEVPPEALPFLEHKRLDVLFAQVTGNFSVFNVKTQPNANLG
ncbi:hypothetical protein ACN9MB_13460 [Dyella kyungheensis]|uniref:hypothetical protein n=1 Tax=Dyella kyungheensis TaxID=1242174 RepID=UPI003CEEBD35